MPAPDAARPGRPGRPGDRADRAGRGAGQVGRPAGAAGDRRRAVRTETAWIWPTTGPCGRRGACAGPRSSCGNAESWPACPPAINQPIVAVAWEPPTGTGPSGGCAVLMRDVAPWLVPATAEPIAVDQHERSCGTWRNCTRPSGRAATSSTSSRRCTATWSCRPGWRRPRRPSARRTWYPGWWPRAGRCWPRSRRPRRRSSSRWRTTRARSWRRWPEPRRRWCTATGSWTTSAPTTRGAPCCSTGSSRGAARRSATWPGT